MSQPEGKPVPLDEARFSKLSTDQPAKLPPDFKLPGGEEMAEQTLERMVEVQRRYDGN